MTRGPLEVLPSSTDSRGVTVCRSPVGWYPFATFRPRTHGQPAINPLLPYEGQT